VAKHLADALWVVPAGVVCWRGRLEWEGRLSSSFTQRWEGPMRRIARTPQVLAAVLFASSGTLNAAERYVDNSTPSACSNSTSGGSQSQPWCTINYAAHQVAPGDVVYVKNGTYNEDVYIEGKNGGENYITFRNYPGHSPVIRGRGVGNGRNKIIDSSFVKFIGFTITNFQQGIFVERSNNIILQNLKVHEVGLEAVQIWSNSSFVTVQDSIIHDTGKLGRYGEGIYVGTAGSGQKSPPYDNTHDILLKGNTIHNTTDECIEVKEGAHNVIIDSNTMHDCLLDPRITSPGWGSIELMQPEKFYGSDPNHIVKNNIIKTAKTGIGVHTGATVFNNVIYGQIAGYRGISISNTDPENYVRRIYHNTIDLPEPQAVVVSGRVSVDIRNNIGPTSAGNMAARDVFFQSKAKGDYHLAPGAAPIDAGVNLAAFVPQDIEGRSRSDGTRPDLGAYEFGVGAGAASIPVQRR
jgi:hypothetical protein